MTPAKNQKSKSHHIQLSEMQKSILEANFEKDPNWCPRKIQELSEKLDLPRIKVYKWNWDHKRKFYIQ